MSPEERGRARSKTAIVIGGGAAGASAAFRLKQAGAAVRLVERENRIGGRTRTEHIDGYIVDVGAGLLPGTYKAVHRLMHDAGLDHLILRLQSPTAVVRDCKLFYLDPSSALRSMMSTRLLRLRSKLALLKIPAHGVGIWNELCFTGMGGAASRDVESVAEYAQRDLGEEVLEYLVGPIVKTMYSTSPSAASVLDFFWCVKNLMSADAFCIKGGMDQLVAGVSKSFDVSVSTEAVAVENAGDRVKVTLRGPDGRESTEHFDVCVIATRSCDIPGMYEELEPAASKYLRELEYSATTDLHLRLKAPPAQKVAVVMVPDSTDRDICTMLFQHNKGRDRVPAGKGAVSVYFHHAWARQMRGLNDAEVFERSMVKIERVLPGIRQLVEGYHVQRWDFTATKSFPGYYKRLASFSSTLSPTARVQLAGDYFALASVNTAVTSGEVAAGRLIERYLE